MLEANFEALASELIEHSREVEKSKKKASKPAV
jgi:hypothetical protein